MNRQRWTPALLAALVAAVVFVVAGWGLLGAKPDAPAWTADLMCSLSYAMFGFAALSLAIGLRR